MCHEEAGVAVNTPAALNNDGRRWLLPDGVEELLPPAALRLENTRRTMLDLFCSWGYELIMPPMLEYIESLLTGFGSDLDLRTLKVIDQLTGRLMGLRADVTSQAARIDAHSLQRDGVARLCYAETVLHSRPGGALGSRAPMVVGAELFGSQSSAADAEILCLMWDALHRVGATGVRIELGHVGIFRALAERAPLAPADTQRLFAAVQMKSTPDVARCLAALDLPDWLVRALTALPMLMGDRRVLDQAAALFASGGDELLAAVSYLSEVAELARMQRSDIALQFDLAELRGYHYHTGVVFAAYVPQHGQAVAQGGRYDGIGAAFGRSRAATGFDADLKLLSALAPAPAAQATVVAPLLGKDDPANENKGVADAAQTQTRAAALVRKVDELRAAGTCVIWGLPETVPTQAQASLQWRDGAWVVITL